MTTIDTSPEGIYAAPDMFLLRLLADVNHRSPSPQLASAVWAPSFGFRIWGNIGNRGLVWQHTATVAAARHARYGSLPFVHEEHGDQGPCGHPAPAAVFLPGDVVLTHWGNADCFVRSVHYVVLPPGTAGFGSLRPNRSAVDGLSLRWRVSDPLLIAAARETYASSEALHRPRKRALFFRGATRERSDETACYRPVTPSAHCRAVYSMGIRAAVQRSIGAHPMVDFNRGAKLLTGGLHALLRTYDFCLSAPGTGFGNRIVDYVVAGCIPVVVRPGGLLLPHEPDLDYSSFAVSVPFEAIPALPSLLANMSADAVAQMRERLREVHRMFIWDEDYGNAYEATLSALLARLRAPARA